MVRAHPVAVLWGNVARHTLIKLADGAIYWNRGLDKGFWSYSKFLWVKFKRCSSISLGNVLFVSVTYSICTGSLGRTDHVGCAAH